MSNDPPDAALRARVWRMDPDIVVWNEVDEPTEHTVETMGEQLAALCRENERMALLINLTGAGRPTAVVRAALRVAFGSVPAFHAAAYTERNLLLNAAAYFVLGGLGLESHSVHRERAEALRAIARARG